jgi:SHS2 domain-containing protein
MNRRFEFLDFATADVCYKAYGKSIEEVYANAALAMFEAIVNTEQIEQKIVKELEINASDYESLMFNWLNELIFLVDVEGIAFSRFDVRFEGEKKLTAMIWGEEIDPSKHELRTGVKACTYHLMEIGKIDDGYYAQILLDV